jgi:hypothetical protein
LKNLLPLRAWLTVPEAARNLSILFGDDVSEADVLRLGLDGRLTLSVHLVNGATAQCGKIIPFDDFEWEGVYLGNDKVFLNSGEIRIIDGVWDLSMIGVEKTEIERKYQLLTGGPHVQSISSNGPLVNHPDGTWGQILVHLSEIRPEVRLNSPYDHPDNYYPAYGLPSDAVLVVRTSALRGLEALMSESEPALERPVERPEPDLERPVGPRERTTLLLIIAALAELNGIDVKKPSKAAMEIESATIRMGARVAARTIEEKLKLIPDVLASKADT